MTGSTTAPLAMTGLLKCGVTGSTFGNIHGFIQPVENGRLEPEGLKASAVAVAATAMVEAEPPSIRLSAPAKNVGTSRWTVTWTSGSWSGSDPAGVGKVISLAGLMFAFCPKI